MASRAVSLLVLGFALACAPRPAPERVLLWTLPATILPSGPRANPVERTLLDADFARHPEDWRLVSDPQRLELDEPPAFETSTGREGERDFVTLAGSHGALFAAIHVEPATCYEFEGAVRVRDLEPASPTFVGATFWLGEVAAARPLQEMVRWQNGGVSERHLFPSALRTSGWQEHRLRFRSDPRTRSLYVACLLASIGEARAGAVDFSAVRLRRIPAARYWEDLLREEIEGRATIDLPTQSWHTERRVNARLGNEDRPSIALFPGERIRFSVRLPSGAPRFTSGVGPWSPAMVKDLGGELSFSLRLNGREIQGLRTPIPLVPKEAEWSHLEADLSANAGDEVELELGLEGDGPGVFGAPLLFSPAPARRGPNLLLVSIDTLRADHVGAYGSTTGSTPRLDRLAREGLLCLDASAPSPWTLPSHATMFSGQFPAVHGAKEKGRTLSAERSPALAEILAESGYATRAFTAGGFLDASFGFDRGFDGFSDIDPLRPSSSPHFLPLHSTLGPEAAERRKEAYGFEGVLRWLEAHRDEPFFLFLHTYTVHDYDAPGDELPCRDRGCTSEAVRFAAFGDARSTGPADDAHLVHLYDGALAYVDGRIGALLDRLDELHLAEDTIVVVTSDHGEELLERGAFGHGTELHEELLRVPLILRVPGSAPRVVERPVMLVDLAPTCLALLGLPPDSFMQGLDFLGPEWPRRPTWGEVEVAQASKYALRDEDGWKLIRNLPAGADASRATVELFLLRRDPGETTDLAARERAKVDELTRKLGEELDACARLGASLGKFGTGELDEATLENLRALGYVR